MHSNVTILGDGHTLADGGYRGLFVTSGTIRVEDLKITDALAQGGNTPDGLPDSVGLPADAQAWRCSRVLVPLWDNRIGV
ncbi:hypothetical protein NKH16_33320 [Mesorhizobium sp. M1307]|uniref:hypothetical protein n=1 Tax=Mesorhizobium sp. M1307 TaxID=2957079 RepID=UPI0033392622